MQKDPTNEMMRRLLVDAGIRPGMRVLDVGCGGGVITEMLAGLVGSEGLVVGIDRDEIALQTASTRIDNLGVIYRHP